MIYIKVMFKQGKKIMLSKLKSTILTLPIVASMLMGAAVLAPAVSVSAATNAIQQGVCEGINQAEGTASNPTGCYNQTTQGDDKVNAVITQVINIFSMIIGAISVIMIIYGGFKYVTSGGDSGKIGSAKNTIIYALIGLVIVALSQVIVRYVLTAAVTGV